LSKTVWSEKEHRYAPVVMVGKSIFEAEARESKRSRGVAGAVVDLVKSLPPLRGSLPKAEFTPCRGVERIPLQRYRVDTISVKLLLRNKPRKQTPSPRPIWRDLLLGRGSTVPKKVSTGSSSSSKCGQPVSEEDAVYVERADSRGDKFLRRVVAVEG